MVAVVAILVLFFGYAARVVTVRAFHNDACLVISMLVANKIEKGEPVSEAAVKNEVAGLIHASVIHGRIASDGSPTDLNGNPFLIQHTTERVTASTKFSLLQPITSHAEAGIKSHNNRSGVDAGRASLFASLRVWPGATHRERYPTL